MKKRFLFLWVLLCALALFYWIYLPVLTKFQDLKSEEDVLQKEIGILNEKIAVLTEEKNRLLNDPEYVERTIRNELGLVGPEEVIYKFLPEEVPPAENEEEVAEGLEMEGLAVTVE